MSISPIYQPAQGFRSQTDRFRDYVNERYSLQLKDYHELHGFSVTRVNDFWLAVWDFVDIRSPTRPTKAINDDARIVDFPRFFEDTKLNYAENLLRGKPDAVAVIEMNELNQSCPRRYTWSDMKALTARYVALLRREAVRRGDVVVIIGGNCARSLALLCAVASIGAMIASFAQDMGEQALKDRVGQLKPRLIVAETKYRYNGKDHDIQQKIANAALLDNTKLLVVKNGGNLPDAARYFEDLVGEESATDLAFEYLPFSTPFVIMFSSGTTGIPKGIVHSHGGLVLNGVKEHNIHNSFGPKDIHFHYSGIGWTLWNISIGAMFCETAMVLYDGSPSYPSCDEFLRNIFAAGVTAYGGSPRYFSELQKQNVRPREYANKMHSLLSTGALLTPGSASWLAEAFGPVCQIGFSGGTELCGNFMTGTRSLPCYPGEIAVKELGMDVEAFGPDGNPVKEGDAGELVCRKPFPNMPVMFWNDPDRKRYNKSYFEGYPGVWTHGDLMRVNPETKGIYVLGRSDGVLNPSGVRFGTSELYNILSAEKYRGIVHDSLAVGQQRTSGNYSDPAERVILFIKVAPEYSSGTRLPQEKLLSRIREDISRDLSRRHVPHFFFEVEEIPHNANGKKMEVSPKTFGWNGTDDDRSKSSKSAMVVKSRWRK